MSSPRICERGSCGEALRAEDLPIGGVTPFTTIDFPGALAAVFYTQGCPWRCRYCYNTHLWPFGKAEGLVPWEEIRKFLGERRGFLEAVVFSGGEPTAHAALPAAMGEVRQMGFKVGLETNGMFPEKLEEFIPLCGWVGMDVKAPFREYKKVTLAEADPSTRTPSTCGERSRTMDGVLAQDSAPRAEQKGTAGMVRLRSPRMPAGLHEAELQRSVEMILRSGVAYEFRTTYHPALLSEGEVLQMAQALAALGARSYVLQGFRREGCLDAALKEKPLTSPLISQALRDSLSALFPVFTVRE